MQNKLRPVSLALAAAMGASGCQSIPDAPPQVLKDFDKVAHVGTVYYKTHMPSTSSSASSSASFVIPVFIGGVIIPITSGPGFGPRTTSFYLHYVQPVGGGPLVRVSYPAEIADKTCVEIVIHKDAPIKERYQMGEAVLKPSTQCK
jgi:hypothetical protein